jgi:hypothetical protein
MKHLNLVLLATLGISVSGLVGVAYAQETDASQIPQNIQNLEPLYVPIANTLTELGVSLANSVVRIIGFIIVIIIGYFVGRGVEKALTGIIIRIFKKKEFQKATGITDKEIETAEGWSALIKLIPLTGKWFVWVYFFVVGIDLLGFQEASDSLSTLWTYIPNILAFIIVVSIGIIGSRIAIKYMEDTKPELFGADAPAKAMKTVVKVIIYVIVFSIGIVQLGVGSDIIPIFLWTIMSGVMAMGAIAGGIGLREIVKNWSYGASVRHLGVAKSAKIKVGNYEGEVLEVGLTHTKIKKDNKIQLIPNDIYITNVIDITEEHKSKI